MIALSSALDTGEGRLFLEISGSLERNQIERGHRVASSVSTVNGSFGDWLLRFVGLRRE